MGSSLAITHPLKALDYLADSSVMTIECISSLLHGVIV